MKKVYKTGTVPDEATAREKIQRYEKWLPTGNGPNPLKDHPELKALVGVEFEFIDKTEAEEKTEQAETDRIQAYKDDHEKFIAEKVRGPRDGALCAWIDLPKARDLEYPLTAAEEQERIDTRVLLLDFPATTTEFIPDEEIASRLEALRPSYIPAPTVPE